MNTDLNNEQVTVTKPDNYDPELGLISIDVDYVNWRLRFDFSMLRLARIVTAKEAERWGFTAAQVSRMMERHRFKGIYPYRPMEIREQLWNHPGEIRGGGYKVEWHELNDTHRLNDPPHFSISFTHLYIPGKTDGLLST